MKLRKLVVGLGTALALAFGSTGWGQDVFLKYGPVAGIQKSTGTTYQNTAAASSDVVSLWSGSCSVSNFLRGDGTCAVPAGTGVTSVGLTAPSWYTVTGSPVTSSGTLAITAATGQTANLFLATPNGSTGAIAERAIVGADLPPINLGSTANGGVLSTSILPGANGGTGNGFTAFSGPSASLKTFGLPNASANILTTNAAVTVAQGGTGVATLPAHGVLLGEGTSNVSNVAAMAADTLLQGQGTGSDPAAVSVNNCGSSTTALSYSTSTHTFGCQTITTGSGTVTSVATGTGLSGGTITTSGTLTVDQTFSPTWTGTHSFSLAPNFNAGFSGSGVSTGNLSSTVTNSSTGANAYASMGVSGSAGHGLYLYGLGGSFSGTALCTGCLNSNDSQILWATGAGGLSIATVTSERIRVSNVGAITINAPTAATALSVTGASGNTGIFLKGGDTSNATTALLIQNSATTNLFYVTDSGSTIVAGNLYNSGITLQTSASTGAVCVNTGTSPAGQFTYNNSSSCTVSSLRFKKNLLPLDAGLDEVMAMRPVSYDLKQDTLHAGRQVGMIAEEMAALDPRLAFNDNDGKPLGIRYEQLTAVLVNAIQQQQREIDALGKRKHHGR